MAQSDGPPDELRAEAMNPATPPDRLRELAFIPAMHALRPLIVQNPNTPPELLCLFAGQHPQEFLANPALPLLLVADPRLGDRLTYWDLQRLSRFETVPALLLSTYPHMLAEDAQTHVNLAGEARDGWEEAVRGYLRQPHTLPQDARRLDILHTPGVTPMWLLSQLATHRNVFVREAVFTHPDLPDPVREWMHTGDHALGQQCAAAGLLAAGQLAEHQPMVSSKAKRHRLAARADVAPEILRDLAQSDDIVTRKRVAANPRTPLDVLRDLARDANVAMRCRVARHPHANGALLEELWHDANLGVRCAVVSHPHLPQEIWDDIQQSVSQLPEAVQHILRRREDTPPDLLAELIVSHASALAVAVARQSEVIAFPAAQTEPESRQAWSQRIQPEGSAEIDIVLLRKCPFASVRRAFALDPRATPAVLEALAEDKDLAVRCAVAWHPHTTADTLARVLKDLDLPRLEEAWRHIRRRADIADRQIAAAVAVAYINAVWNRRYPRPLLWRFQQSDPRMQGYVEIDGITRIVCMTMLASSVTSTQALDEYGIRASWFFWQLRYAITRNPNASTELLETLCHDGNRYVRASARAALTRRQSRER